MYGLRVAGMRGIRARFPNADPETASSSPPWVDNGISSVDQGLNQASIDNLFLGYGGFRADNGWIVKGYYFIQFALKNYVILAYVS